MDPHNYPAPRGRSLNINDASPYAPRWQLHDLSATKVEVP